MTINEQSKIFDNRSTVIYRRTAHIAGSNSSKCFMQHVVKSLIGLCFMLLILCPRVNAQWSTDPFNSRMITTFGSTVNACPDGTGGFFVAFNSDPGPSIWIQRVDKYGYKKWAQPKQITGKGLLIMGDFQLIPSSDSSAFVIYRDADTLWDSMILMSSPARTYYNKIDVSGNLQWGADEKSITNDTVRADGLSIVSDKNGGFYIAWILKYGVDVDSTHTMLQKISADGEKEWGENGRYVDTWAAYNYSTPHISNRFPDGIFLYYNKEGSGVTVISINTDYSYKWIKSSPWLGRIIPTTDGGGVWAENYYKNSNGNCRLMANKITSGGEFAWSDSGIVIKDDVPNNYVAADYKVLNDGTVAILHKFLYLLTKDGALKDYDTTKTFETGVNSGVRIIPRDSSEFIVIWGRSDTSRYYCQKYNTSGKSLWGNDVLFGTRNWYEYSIVDDGRGGFIAVWSGTFVGLETQQVSCNGVLGEVLTGIREAGGNNHEKFSLGCYPNPFNPNSIIGYQIREAGNVTLKVYDALGREVRTLVNENKSAGKYNVRFDGSNLASGIYFYRLTCNEFTSTKKMILMK
jgi:hypothetical protein